MAASFIQYIWNAVAGRFVGRDGRFVSALNVQRAFDAALRGAGDDAKDIAAAFSNGTIGVVEFERQMQRLIKDTQVYAAAVAAGGFGNIGARELQTLETRLGEQFAYLSDFADDLAAGVPISAGQLGARARMYALSAGNTYDVTYRAGQIARGFDQERNILHPGESCAVCIGQRDLGWVPIGTLIPIGRRTCLSNDNCTIEYRKSA